MTGGRILGYAATGPVAVLPETPIVAMDTQDANQRLWAGKKALAELRALEETAVECLDRCKDAQAHLAVCRVDRAAVLARVKAKRAEVKAFGDLRRTKF